MIFKCNCFSILYKKINIFIKARKTNDCIDYLLFNMYIFLIGIAITKFETKIEYHKFSTKSSLTIYITWLCLKRSIKTLKEGFGRFNEISVFELRIQ